MIYAKFRPTGFDQHIPIADREGWIVVPCGHNRDSGLRAESNFHVALDRLGGESDTVEVRRFGHWANGWFEIILAHPLREADVLVIADKLDSYPILDESDLSERESAAEGPAWTAYGASDVRKVLRDTFDLHSTADWFTDDRLWDLYSDKSSGTEHTDEGPTFVTDWITGPRFDRGDLARWIRQRRMAERSKS